MGELKDKKKRKEKWVDAFPEGGNSTIDRKKKGKGLGIKQKNTTKQTKHTRKVERTRD